MADPVAVTAAPTTAAAWRRWAVAEDLDYCARLYGVDAVPLQTEPGVLKPAQFEPNGVKSGSN